MKVAKPTEFDSIFKIMKSAFPRNEYRSYACQKTLFDSQDYIAYVCEKDGEICAFISVWQFDSFAYIEHFAVLEKYRNCGLGKQMLDELKEMSGKRLCLEVELPINDNAKRRIAFYERNGFYYNDYPYEQPPFSKDRDAVPLRIMCTKAPLTKQEFENIKNQLYKRVYNA